MPVLVVNIVSAVLQHVAVYGKGSEMVCCVHIVEEFVVGNHGCLSIRPTAVFLLLFLLLLLTSVRT